MDLSFKMYHLIQICISFVNNIPLIIEFSTYSTNQNGLDSLLYNK